MHTSMGIMSHLQAPAFFDTVDKSPRLGGGPSLLPAITWIPPRTGAVSWPASRRRSASARARDVASRAPVACPLQTKAAKQLLRQRNIGNRISSAETSAPESLSQFQPEKWGVYEAGQSVRRSLSILPQMTAPTSSFAPPKVTKYSTVPRSIPEPPGRSMRRVVDLSWKWANLGAMMDGSLVLRTRLRKRFRMCWSADIPARFVQVNRLPPSGRRPAIR